MEVFGEVVPGMGPASTIVHTGLRLLRDGLLLCSLLPSGSVLPVRLSWLVVSQSLSTRCLYLVRGRIGGGVMVSYHFEVYVDII